MAIILKSKKYNEIQIDSKTIIGVLGYKREDFLSSLQGDNVCLLNKVSLQVPSSINNEYYKKLEIDTIASKRFKSLSQSEKKRLQYYLMIESNKKIFVINEPYLDLDYNEKKKVNYVINKLIKEGKTIIISSSDINDVYSICKKVLLIKENEISYQNISCLTNISLLKEYQLEIPSIVNFIRLAREKNKKIPYSKDIRDLIKDVYRNVSKK